MKREEVQTETAANTVHFHCQNLLPVKLVAYLLLFLFPLDHRQEAVPCRFPLLLSQEVADVAPKSSPMCYQELCLLTGFAPPGLTPVYNQ